MGSREYFNRVSKEWDRMRAEFFSDEVRTKALSRVVLEPGRLAADLGAGTGFMTEGLIKAGLKVIAVDQSLEMIETMKNIYEECSDIEYRLVETGQLPFGADEVDYVFANMFLHHVESPAESIKEMARILKSGGIAVISDLDKHNHEFLRVEQKDRWLGFTRKSIRLWFTHAGFKEIQIDPAGENCCAESSCGCDKASVNIFIASGKKIIS
jgi:ubiquinone/menaquinone biosynthesis C-methylase UbiE